MVESTLVAATLGSANWIGRCGPGGPRSWIGEPTRGQGGFSVQLSRPVVHEADTEADTYLVTLRILASQGDIRAVDLTICGVLPSANLAKLLDRSPARRRSVTSRKKAHSSTAVT